MPFRACRFLRKRGLRIAISNLTPPLRLIQTRVHGFRHPSGMN
jgi:hypothetical protein